MEQIHFKLLSSDFQEFKSAVLEKRADKISTFLSAGEHGSKNVSNFTINYNEKGGGISGVAHNIVRRINHVDISVIKHIVRWKKLFLYSRKINN